MKLLILNQYAPPAQAPTSRLVDELRAFFVHQGHTVRIVSERAEYRGHHARTGRRLLRELKALAVITWGALLSKPRPDVILALSSPPCLLVAAALVAGIRRLVLAHWAMDLYPDLAIALGELPPTGPSRIFRTLMRWAYRRCQRHELYASGQHEFDCACDDLLSSRWAVLRDLSGEPSRRS